MYKNGSPNLKSDIPGLEAVITLKLISKQEVMFNVSVIEPC